MAEGIKNPRLCSGIEMSFKTIMYLKRNVV